MPKPQVIYTPTFWRTTQYSNYAEAVFYGGIYGGEKCDGDSLESVMQTVLSAVDCMDSTAGNDDLMVHLVVDLPLSNFRPSYQPSDPPPPTTE